MFLATDATLVEVNPLAETPDGRGSFAGFEHAFVQSHVNCSV